MAEMGIMKQLRTESGTGGRIHQFGWGWSRAPIILGGGGAEPCPQCTCSPPPPLPLMKRNLGGGGKCYKILITMNSTLSILLAEYERNKKKKKGEARLDPVRRTTSRLAQPSQWRGKRLVRASFLEKFTFAKLGEMKK